MKLKHLLFSILALLVIGGSAWGASYTVTQSGTGTPYSVAEFNAGGAPFDDLDGDTVTFSPGTITTGLDLPDGGASGDEVTLIGTGCTISGFDTLSSWTLSDGEYYATEPTNLDAATYTSILHWGGTALEQADNDSQTTNGDGDLLTGQWCRDTDSAPNRIYVFDNPSGVTVTCAGGEGIDIDNGQAYVNIIGFTITGAQHGIRIYGDAVDVGSNWDISKVDISHTLNGIMHERGNGLTVDKSEFSYCNNRAIKFGNEAAATTVSVTDCKIHDGASWLTGLSTEGHAIDFMPGCSGITVTGNDFYNHGYSGGATSDNADAGSVVSFDDCSTVVVSGNDFYDNYIGCIDAGIQEGANTLSAVQIVNNVFRNNSHTTTIDGQCAKYNVIKIYNGDADNHNITTTIANNDFYSNQGLNDGTCAAQADYAIACISVRAEGAGKGNLSGLSIYNNIFSGNVTDFDFTTDEDNGLTYTANNNLYYRSGGGDYLNLDGTEYPSSNSWAAYQAASGESASLDAADPQFVNTAKASTYGLQLRGDSPCIGAGTSGGSIPTTDFNGYATIGTKDIGAHEWAFVRSMLIED